MAAKSTPASPPKQQLTLHKATTEDIPILESMTSAAYTKYISRIGKPPAPMTEDWVQTIRTNTVLVLRDIDQTVGSITFHKEQDTNSLKIENVVVDPTAQARGYGSYMIKNVEAECRKQSLPCITLYTNVKMFENIGYYAKMGFVETGRRMEDGFERVYLCKEIL
ncbi:Acyl-CoA N-acyltransferase [Penicillium sp. IBT 31633x]|nr:Acyl-CoA N-acyltransferase [Penicillium sp. IBT 31633x]